MKIRHYLLQKPSILIWVSVLSGFFVTSEEIMDCIELSRIRGIDPEIDSILLLIFQCLFSSCSLGYYYKLTYVGSLRKRHLKQFAYSSLVSVLFSLIVWLGVSPVIRSTNQNIREKYERNEPKENHRFHGKKLFYLFHEPEEAWYNNLFTLFVGIYTFSRIISSPHVKRKWSETTRN